MNTFRQMIERGHERVCFHHDPDTGLRAIIGIHSTRLGHALGGVRRWHYATEADALSDVLRLSQAMTLKAAAADLPMGGGKSVILLPNSNHPTSRLEGPVACRIRPTYRSSGRAPRSPLRTQESEAPIRRSHSRHHPRRLVRTITLHCLD